MARISWTEQALSDIQEICGFIEKDSFRYAQIFADKVFAAVENLSKYPELGRVVPEYNNARIREIIFGNYRIIYKYKHDEIVILTVYHSARLLD
ncbi:MAG: type II toxin-antitoxin system RelE/ParE family toxin [Ignavibacteriales bacterium]|nr:type II toxin-antitoxin system RelE/ParE family toxin [Ignavibacteriales bacterium]